MRREAVVIRDVKIKWDEIDKITNDEKDWKIYVMKRNNNSTSKIAEKKVCTK